MKWIVMSMVAAIAGAAPVFASEVVAPIDGRFSGSAQEVPDFRRHVVPLLGKLGCNGRACHGSFQGQGGFQLSLFGYDFKMDHEGLLGGDEPRTNLKAPAESLILQKPTEGIPHEGGKRMDPGSWQHAVLLRWIEGGAPSVKKGDAEFVRLDVTPGEIVSSKMGQTFQLKVISVWSDGSREDVTPLCRFQTNDDQIAEVSKSGLVMSAGPGDTHVVVFYDNGVVPVPVMMPVSDKVGPKYPSVPVPTEIDRLVVEKLRKLGIVPSELADDAAFLRRVSLDMTGTLPAPQEVEAFLADSTSDKRARKIDELLERPAYAAWWATQLCDFTGNNSRQFQNVGIGRNEVATEWYDWVHKRVAENVPYDQIVERILLATSREEDQSFQEFLEEYSSYYRKDSEVSFADRDSMPHFWTRRNFRTPEDRALGFAYAFLGIRIQCAQCHKHPFDEWTKDDFEQFKGFFTHVNYGVNPESRREYDQLVTDLGLKGKKGNQLQRELPKLLRDGKIVPFQEVYVVPPGRNGSAKERPNRRRGGRGATKAKLLGDEMIDLTQYDDPRRALMDWLRGENNPYFARAFVNRVWAAYFGVGIVDPPDDLSLANPPSNRPLLDTLTRGFIEHGYDIKWLHREIAGSRTYQIGWTPNETNRLDERNFSRALPRRLPAEVAYDAIRFATASDAEVARMQSEVKGRSIAAPVVDSRNQNGTYALTIFGKSLRESNCDCERSTEPSLLQTVFLQNDQEVLTMITRRGGWVDQVTGGTGGKETPAAEDAREGGGRQADARKREIAALEKELQRLKKAENERRAAQVEKRLERLRRQQAKQTRQARLDDSSERAPDVRANKPADLAPLSPDAIVRQAYLRTLNRQPTPDETRKARQFLAQSGDPAAGTRDLLWALLNTKEFIVNH